MPLQPMQSVFDQLKSTLLRRTLVMGILNVTPDSFSGDGLDNNVDAAVAQGRAMAHDGADILDVGGQSTRPGAVTIPVQGELSRVIPVITRLAAHDGPGLAISVDTSRSVVADAALRAGAHIVNDISGLRDDPAIADVVAQHDAGLVVMHIQGTPATMQLAPHYDDLLAEIIAYLQAAIDKAVAAGVRKDRIWVDPGIGFGKTLHHNLEIIKRLRELEVLGSPILIGTSRKGFIGRILAPLNNGEPLPPQERVAGTGATLAISIANGVGIVRVHDVAPAVQVARVADAIVRSSNSTTSPRTAIKN
jgi:dihydropteroate synthase